MLFIAFLLFAVGRAEEPSCAAGGAARTCGTSPLHEDMSRVKRDTQEEDSTILLQTHAKIAPHHRAPDKTNSDQALDKAANIQYTNDQPAYPDDLDYPQQDQPAYPPAPVGIYDVCMMGPNTCPNCKDKVACEDAACFWDAGACSDTQGSGDDQYPDYPTYDQGGDDQYPDYPTYHQGGDHQYPDYPTYRQGVSPDNYPNYDPNYDPAATVPPDPVTPSP